MPKVRFIGKGTQYHPTLGRLTHGQVYELPKDVELQPFFERVKDNDRETDGATQGEANVEDLSGRRNGGNK